MFVPQFVTLSLCTLLKGHWSHMGGPDEVTVTPGTLPVLLRASREGSPPVPFSGWCKDPGPCEGDVKASLPFHGALIWPFHWVKPKEIHVHDLCGASLHSGTGRKKIASGWLGLKRADPCAHRTHDPWTLTFKERHEGESGVGFDWKSNMGIVNIALLANVGMKLLRKAGLVTNMRRIHKVREVNTAFIHCYLSCFTLDPH